MNLPDLLLSVPVTDGRLVCPECGAPLNATIPVAMTVQLTAAGGIDYVSESDPDADAMTDVRCPECNWRYTAAELPTETPLLYSCVIPYADALAWELHKTTLREQLADEAFEKWWECDRQTAEKHADTYLADVTVTAEGYRVRLTAGDIPPARYFVTPSLDGTGYTVWRCDYPDCSAHDVGHTGSCANAIYFWTDAQALTARPQNGQIIAPEGTVYTIVQEYRNYYGYVAGAEYPWQMFECYHPHLAARVMLARQSLADLQAECPYGERLTTPVTGGRFTAPDGTGYTIIPPAAAG